jgi:hypothetical protein
MHEQAHQHGVLEDVGEIAGVKSMAVIHPASRAGS